MHPFRSSLYSVAVGAALVVVAAGDVRAGWWTPRALRKVRRQLNGVVGTAMRAELKQAGLSPAAMEMFDLLSRVLGYRAARAGQRRTVFGWLAADKANCGCPARLEHARCVATDARGWWRGVTRHRRGATRARPADSGGVWGYAQAAPSVRERGNPDGHGNDGRGDGRVSAPLIAWTCVLVRCTYSSARMVPNGMLAVLATSARPRGERIMFRAKLRRYPRCFGC